MRLKKYFISVPNTEIICQHANPEGLTLLDDFISSKEEQLFIDLFNWVDHSESSLKNRQVSHYGYEFRYGSNDVDLNSPLLDKIPPECDMLWRRLKEHGFEIREPDQLTVNKYKPGQGNNFFLTTFCPKQPAETMLVECGNTNRHGM